MSTNEIERLIRTRQRVIDHGEVFTPRWLVEDMLDLVGDEAARIDSRVLEPACGSGNFLSAVLERKLRTVDKRYRKSDFEKKHQALFALMCLYGIEILRDNAGECRDNLLALVTSRLGIGPDDIWTRAAAVVLTANIVHGDALAMTTQHDGQPIIFPEWSYVGRGQFQRRDFAFRDIQGLTPTPRRQLSLIPGLVRNPARQLSLPTDQHVFRPVRTYRLMTIAQIGAATVEPAR